MPPRVVAGYRRRVQQQEGTTMRLECPVSAQPTALVSWYKNGREINIAWDRYRVVAVGRRDSSGLASTRRREVSQLRVRNATAADSGFYVCTATNGFGTVRASFQVLVDRTSHNVAHRHYHYYYISSYRRLRKLLPRRGRK